MSRRVPFSAADESWMKIAIASAKKGLGKTAPNPAVGCVLVKSERELARGWHRRAGTPHAEADALSKASGQRASTAYVTLEPCSHFGRTPPCADALVDAGVRRVVVGCLDPNPVVSGRGIRRLKRAGIKVEVGCLGAACEDLIRGYAHQLRTGRPFVHLKMAASLDGRIASRTGASKWISSEASRRVVQQLRARSDAILVGVGTVLADDPRLTARIRSAKDPQRVVLDRRLRTPPDASVITGSGGALVVGGKNGAPSRRRKLEQAGGEVIELDTDGRRGWNRLLAALAKRDVAELLIEGGAKVAAAAVRARAVDRLTVFYNPRLIGGDGVPMLESLGVADPGRGPKLTPVSVEDCGGDLVWTGDFL